MTPQIIIRRTDEIGDVLWGEIVDGFNESFGLRVSVNGLKNGWYISNPWGYAYHAMAFDENDELMAYNVFTPAQYENGIKVVVSGSTFVRKKFRKNVMLFARLIKALRERCAKDGFDLEVGVPNHNSLNYHLKVNKVKLVDDLPYFVLPINLSKTVGKSMWRIIDLSWKQLLKVHLFFNKLLSRVANGKEHQRKYSIATGGTFYKTRFNNPEYKCVSEKGCTFVFRNYNEDGRQVVYLMDFRADGIKSYSALMIALQYIIRHIEADTILYVGFMHFKQCLMLKLPKRMAPKRLPLTCYLLHQEEKEQFQDLENPDNWNFSLMSFDVR